MSGSEIKRDDQSVTGGCCGASGPEDSSLDDRQAPAGPVALLEGPRPAAAVPLAVVSFNLGGMSCQSCAVRLTAALGRLPGVEGAWVDFASRRGLVHVNPEATLNDLQAVVENEGYRFWGAKVEVVEPGSSPAAEARSGSNAREGTPDAADPAPADCCALEGTGPVRTGWRPYVFGLIAAVAVVGFYLGLVTLTSNWYYARAQFGDYYGWILALALGLGVQVMLFTKFRTALRRRGRRAAGSTLAASGGVSAASMAACCAHYLAAFLPALGLSFLSGAAAALERYQAEFFLVGVLSNLFGIWLMLGMMARHGVITVESTLARRVLRVRLLA